MGLFAWSKEYSVNIKSFDGEHQQLFSMVAELHDAMRCGQGRTVLDGLLSELIRYTQNHFAAEERALTAYNFPGLAGHKSEHVKLTEQVLAFQKDFKAGNAMITIDLMEFLQNWLTQHILATDKNYGTFLSSKGVN